MQFETDGLVIRCAAHNAFAAAEIATIVQVYIGTCGKEMSAFIDQFF